MKISVRHFFSFILFIILSGISPALAFKLEPISRVFEPAGAGATQSYQVINDSAEQIAVELSIAERKISLEGQESIPNRITTPRSTISTGDMVR